MRLFLRSSLLMAALAAWPAKAALAPEYQRLAELRAVLNLDLAALMGPTPIERVAYAGVDLYRVTAGRCHLDVRIVGLPMPQGVDGARRFQVRPGRRLCAR